MRDLTGAQRALLQSGRTAEQCARAMSPKSRPTRREIREKAIYVRRVLAEGGAGESYARRLASLIGYRADWLMLPRLCWPDSEQPARLRGNQDAVETPADHGAATLPAAAATGTRLAPRPRPNQMTVLRKI